MCIDHPEVQSMVGRISDRRIVTYGESPQADIRAVNISYSAGGSNFDVVSTDRASGNVENITGLRLPMPGIHNILNSLVTFAVAGEMGIDGETVRKALAGFEGVKRRFTRTGEAGGITVIDDYAHHPVEISAVLAAARNAYSGKVIAVVQPHRYSRLQDLFAEFCNCFNDADTVIVANVFAAGEDLLPGFDRDSLAEGLRSHGHRRVLVMDDALELAALAASEADAGDLVVCLGAGNITAWANALPAELEEYLAHHPKTGEG